MIDYEIASDIRDEMRYFIRMAEAVDEHFPMDETEVGEGSFAELAFAELEMFLLFLTASDGMIEDEEVELFNYLHSNNLTAEQLKNVIVETRSYSSDFANTFPTCLSIAVMIDEAAEKRLGRCVSFTDSLLGTYKTCGKLLLRIDGNIDKSEVEDLVSYIEMLERGIEEERLKAKLMLL